MRARIPALHLFILTIACAMPLASKAGEQFDPKRASSLFHDGRVNDALDVLEHQLKRTAKPFDRWLIAEHAAKMCRSSRSVVCLSQRALPLLMSSWKGLSEEKQRKTVWPLYYWQTVVAAKLGEANWFASDLPENLRNGIGDVESLPTLLAQSKIALSTMRRLQGDLSGSHLYARQALAVLLTLPPTEALRYTIATNLAEIIRLYKESNDWIRAARLLTVSEDFLLSTLGAKTTETAEFFITRAELLLGARAYEEAKKDLTSAIEILGGLQIDAPTKDVYSGLAHSYLAALYAHTGDHAKAVEIFAGHPLHSRRAELIKAGSFKSYNEFIFAVSDTYVSGVSGRSADRRWLNHFNHAPAWTKPEKVGPAANLLADSFRAFAPFSRAMILFREDEAEAIELLAESARVYIDQFERDFSKIEGAFPFPNFVQDILIGNALSILSRHADRFADLLLRGTEIVGRSFEHATADALSSIAPIKDAERRSLARTSLRLAAQEADLESRLVREFLTKFDAVSTDPASAKRDTRGYQLLLSYFRERIAIRHRENGQAINLSAHLPGKGELQGALRQNEAFLLYFASAGQLHKLCIRRNGIVQSRSPINSDQVIADSKVISAALISPNPPSLFLDSQYPVDAALRMYSFLFDGLGSCLPSGTHIIYSEFRPIGRVPLQVLLTSRPKSRERGYDLRSADWLILKHPVSRVASIRAFIAARRIGERAGGQLDFLGVGDPSLARRLSDGKSAGQSIAQRSAPTAQGTLENLAELPETAAELRAIGKRFQKSTVLIREQATEEAIRLLPLSQYNVINFATHGLVRGDLDGLTEAALVLTPTGQETADPLTDGLLTATELAAFDLNARLAVLSACNTANFDAQLFAGQVQGLYTAFALAGIPTVVASLWPVESTTSQRLMVGLFERLTQETSASVSEAFAETLRDAIQNPASPEFSHPRFWAPFVVLGDGAISLRRTNEKYHISPLSQSVSEDEGDILRVIASRTGSYYVSGLGKWDGQRYSTLIQERAASGKIIWERWDPKRGGGLIAASQTAIYAPAFTSREKGSVTRQFLRAYSLDGKALWERPIALKSKFSLPSDVAVDHNGDPLVLFVHAAVTAESADEIPPDPPIDLTLISFNKSGDETGRLELNFEVPNYRLQRPKLAVDGRAIYLVVNVAPEAAAKYDTDHLGLRGLCLEGGSTFIYKIDTAIMNIETSFRKSGFLTESISFDDRGLLVAGGIYRKCESTVTAAVGRLSQSKFSIVWAHNSPLPSVAISATKMKSGRYLVLGNAIGVINLEKRANDPDRNGPKRRATDSYKKFEGFSVVLDASGKLRSKRSFTAGLSLEIRDGLAGSQLVAVGTIGGKRLWLEADYNESR